MTSLFSSVTIMGHQSNIVLKKQINEGALGLLFLCVEDGV